MSSAFTPKSVNRMRAKIEERAEQIVDRVRGAGEVDFVAEVSAKLPMMTVADLVGVPEGLVQAFAEAGNNYVGSRDPEINSTEDPVAFALKQVAVLREIGVELVAHRRKHPADDIATSMANAVLDGRRLDDDDIESMMVLLSVAGNDTTKQTTTHTVVELWKQPEQKAWLKEDYDARIGRATEEFVRHASPVIAFARSATKDVELGGERIREGDKVVLFYASANRDESVFEDPHRFDLQRPAAPHAAFGGGGVHYCLGNGIAKAQLRALFAQFLTKLESMTITGEPEPLASPFINGIRHLQVHIP